MKNRSLKRIFIVGCPRSGTTLLQGMLSGHSTLISFPETHILRIGVGRNTSRISSFFKRKKLIDLFFKEHLVNSNGTNNSRSNRKSRQFITQEYLIRSLVDVFDSNAKALNYEGWIEKTPEHIFFIRHLEKLYPDVKFIHIVRDGGPVTASIIDMWRTYTANWPKWRLYFKKLNDFVKAITIINNTGLDKKISLIADYSSYIRATGLWNDSLTETFSNQQKENHYVCYYEKLTSDPSIELNKICIFLGIEFQNAMLDPEHSAKSLIRKNEKWKKDNYSQIRAASTDKFDRLDEELKELLTKLLLAEGNAKKFLED